MMRRLFFLACLVPMLGLAQDFTREYSTAQESSLNSTRANQLLVLPYHPHFHISEVDRMMTPGTMDPAKMREKIRSAVSRAITQAFSDSLETVDLSISVDEEMDVVEYVYNAMDYNYSAFDKPETEEKKRFKLRLPKKEKEKVYGARSVRSEGQLKREEIMHDRYMSARVANTAALEYLQDLYAFEHMIAITQLEITRDLENPTGGNYQCSLHLELIDKSGKSRYGYKHKLIVTPEDLEYGSFKSEVLKRMALEIRDILWPYFITTAPELQDNTDY